MEIIRSNKGKEKICFQGHMYTKQIVRSTIIRWRCVKRTSFCKGSMTTSLDMTDPQPANDHNHATDYAAIAATKSLNKMKVKAAETEDKPSQIYSSNLVELPAEAKALLPSEDVI